MTIDEMKDRLAAAGATIPGRKLKLDFGPDGVIMLDGVMGDVTRDDGDADTSITIAWDDWKALAKGELDPMSAFMTGRLKVHGDMALAMQVQSMMSKLRG
jgi:putative sterol carrier protein